MNEALGGSERAKRQVTRIWGEIALGVESSAKPHKLREEAPKRRAIGDLTPRGGGLGLAKAARTTRKGTDHA